MALNPYIKYILILSITLGITVTIAYLVSAILNLPINILTVINAVLIASIGAVTINVVSRFLKVRVSNYIGKTTAESVSLVIQVLGYTIIAIVILTSLHVGDTSALFGGTVFGLVVGLALQGPLSNIFSGLLLIFSRPFNVGERVTITTWQYGLIAPSYPPKFWSNDFLIPGYTGVIMDISLIYTTILTDENVLMKIPNSIISQAAVFVHKEEYRLVRTKYEVQKDVEPDEIIPQIKERLKGLGFLVKDPEVKILDTTLNTYVLAIDAYCKGQYEEPPRSEIIKAIMKVVKEYREEKMRAR